MTTALRYDNAPLRKATRTPQGFLKAPARVTRAGVFQYTRADGSTSHELRHPDDVFDSGSLASLASAPVTVDHPATPVTAANARDHMVGFGSESPRRDGDFVESALTITDAAAVARAELPRTDSAVLCEVSLGYTARIVPETGVYQGQRYDARQRDIRYNHIALGPAGWGRAGSSVAMRLDALASGVVGAAWRFDATPDNDVSIPHMDTVEIRIDGVTVAVPKTAADVIAKSLADGAAALVVARKDAADKDAALGTASAELAAAKADLAAAREAAKPEVIQARADARTALITDARKVLGVDYRADGLSDVAVQTAAVAKARPEMALAGRSDDYIAAAFRFVCDSVGVDSLAAVRGPAPIVDVRADAATARADRAKRNATAWKIPGAKGDAK